MDAAPASPLIPSPHPPSTAAIPWTWRTPLVALVVYCLVSLFLKENYPFSHYPMYANPSADRSYYIIADAATGKPVPIASVSGITSPKIGKTYRTKSEEIASRLKIKKNDLPPAQQQEAGAAIFGQLRQSAKEGNRTGLPARLMLQRVDILWKNNVMTEQPTTLATE